MRNKDYSKHIYCNPVLSLDRTYSAISLKKQFNCLEVSIHSILWLFDKTNPADSGVAVEKNIHKSCLHSSCQSLHLIFIESEELH